MENIPVFAIVYMSMNSKKVKNFTSLVEPTSHKALADRSHERQKLKRIIELKFGFVKHRRML